MTTTTNTITRGHLSLVPDFVDTGIDRDDAVAAIRRDLKARTRRTWSVRGGRGSDWGWITITAPPARRGEYGRLSDDDQAILAAAMGLDFGQAWGGVTVPASSAHRREFMQRAAGVAPSEIATAYWD